MKRILKSNLSIKFFVISILALIVISIACAPLVPIVQAAEPNLQAKTLTVLSDVVGVNTDLYTPSKSSERSGEFLGSSQKETDTQLSSAQSNLRVTCSYVKDTLKLVYLSDLEGELSLKQPASKTVDMAKGLLERYQTYSVTSIYGKFASMLNGIEVNVDETKYAENVKLEVSGSSQNRVSYTWTYVDSNGVTAEKKNVIIVYEKGVFKGFFNNWPFYTISESESKFSAEQATKLAIAASKDYSYPVICDNGTEIMVAEFNIAPESLGEAKLIYVNSVDQEFARGSDPYRMYLAWFVPLGFDRFYPGDVSGLTVILWADTGEVCGMDRVIVDSGLGFSSNKQTIEDKEAVVQLSQTQSTDLSTQAIGISALAGLVFVSLGTSKKIMSTGNRKRVCKFWGALLCASVVFSIIFVSLPSVSAASATGRSRVYSCVGTDDGYNNEDADRYEELATAELCNYVGNASLDAGYVTSNSYSNTINTAVVSNAGSDEQNYLGTMVFHAGHFSEENEAYQDKNGDQIHYNNIYPQTGLGRHFFVFLWVCVQAEDHTSGTPVGWTHRASPNLMSPNGFNDSDGQGQCYISFYGFSPMLSCYVNQSNGYYYNFADLAAPSNTSWFAMKFYYYALYEEYSVHDSLDLASNEFFGCDYEQTVLNTGYHSWWPGGDWPAVWCEEHGVFDENPLRDPGYYPRDFNEALSQHPWNGARDANRMRVFGDSEIKLYQPELILAAVDENNDELPSSPIFVVDEDNGYGLPNSIRVTNKVHEIAVTDNIFGYQFDHFSYNYVNYYNNPSDISITSDGVLKAHYVPDQHVCIASSSGGYTDPAYGYYRGSGSMQITVYPYNGYQFDYWLLNGNYYSSSQTIYVDYGSNTVQPVFSGNPTYWLNIDAYETYYQSSIDPAVYVDNYFVGYAPASVEVSGGYHTVAVEEYCGNFYLTGFSDSLGNGDSRLVQSTTYLTAYYDLGGK